MTEQQPYAVVERRADFELRRYPAHLVAPTEVEAPMEAAVNRGFRVLADYIFGANQAKAKVAMTTPVLQQSAGEPIAMTAPVLQAPGDRPGRYVISFVMPAGYTLDTLPTPLDVRVQWREVAAELAAARRFSGLGRAEAFSAELDRLTAAVRAAGLTVVGPARSARFDPPWKPWFLRRNEVVLPVAGQPSQG